MRRSRVGWMMLALASSAAPSLAVTPGIANGPLQASAPGRPVKGPSDVYLVRLTEPGALNYQGSKSGFAATRPPVGRKINAKSGAVQSYVQYLEATHDRLLERVGAGAAKVYSFRYAFNGFAAQLTPAQVSRLHATGAVERIWLDSVQHVQTNNSAIFLGLENQTGGLRADLDLRGEDVVIGVIDSGIATNHPSLADTEERLPRGCTSSWAETSWLGLFLCGPIRRNPPTVELFNEPAGFNGVCQSGEGFDTSHCNNKLVGARFYIDGFLMRNELDPGEFISPKDADGHGTHIATIAAGNPGVAELFGVRLGRISGIAPRARVAVYKACWLKPGDTRASCATSDLARAIDDAVADGVDIINYSVGSLETDLTAPDDFALLNALGAGVFSAVAAGNDGPNQDTIGSPSAAPWVLTVAASTQSGERFEEAINITAPIELEQLLGMKEASFTPLLQDLGPLEGELRLIDDGAELLANGSPGSPRDACEPLVNVDALKGHIVLIERGGCEFQVKLERADEAGAIAAVVYNNAGQPIVMNGETGSVNIPAVMIGTADGQLLVDELAAGTEVRLQLEKGIFLSRSDSGNQMARFSSRGPTASEPDFIKPDVTAPGVHILAGHSRDAANAVRGQNYQYQSGTSQSAPEVAGIAALLKEAHPDWTAATLKSALTTSAYQSVFLEDGVTPADPFDMGAGHVDPNRALDPGLIYDTSFLDYAAYLCGLEDPPISGSDCTVLAAAGFSSEPRALNLPTIGVGELITGDEVLRTVTNIGPPATYTLQVEPPLGIDVLVQPPTLSLGSGQSAQYSVAFQRRGAPLGEWAFGRLAWSDGIRSVASPIAVRPVTIRAPAQLSLSGTTGNESIPVAFGYTGSYRARPHGLNAALELCVDDAGEPATCFVDDDPNNNFSFRFDGGVNAHLVNISDDQLYARFALFDEVTDGADDLDLYLFICPDNQCTQIAESGSFTSEEEINLIFPAPGLYAILVHGFETDEITGGPGANYRLFAWSFGVDDDARNLQVVGPSAVGDGERLSVDLNWTQLSSATRYLGGVSHNTPNGLYGLTIVTVN